MLPQPTCTGQQYSVMNGVVSGSESATEGSSHGIVPALMVKLAEARLAHDPVAKAHATDLGRLREVRAANTQVLVRSWSRHLALMIKRFASLRRSWRPGR